jgi:diadenosine tetraphosphate (Ap4A) HIT family hydrolase
VTDAPTCYFCKKHRTGDDPPPGGWLVEDRDWLVGHGPVNMCLAGTVRIESRRHFIDFAEMTDSEAASFGRLVTDLYRSVRFATRAERIHLLATMDYQPHFHVWLYPRAATERLRGTAFLNQQMSCTPADAEAVSARIRAALVEGAKDPPAKLPAS